MELAVELVTNPATEEGQRLGAEPGRSWNRRLLDRRTAPRNTGGQELEPALTCRRPRGGVNREWPPASLTTRLQGHEVSGATL